VASAATLGKRINFKKQKKTIDRDKKMKKLITTKKINCCIKKIEEGGNQGFKCLRHFFIYHAVTFGHF
jgi:hypothetical protein